MWPASKCTAFALLLSLASWSAYCGGVAAAEPAVSPTSALAGRWSGWGAIVRVDGATEQVRCIAVYKAESPAAFEQDLRCASAGARIDAHASLTVDGDRVTGAWREQTTATTGSVTGRISASGLNLNIEGAAFSAAMAVTTADCTQSITIAPRGHDVARITVGLARC